MPQAPHRKQNRHFNVPGHLHFMTFSCHRRMQLLTNDLFRNWLARALDKALAAHEFQLSGFVFMPEHVHLLVWPQREKYSMAAFQHAFKQPFSSRIKKHLASLNSPLLEKLTVLERPGKPVFRFWQEGGGFDRNVWSQEYIFKIMEYMHNNPVKRGLVKSPDKWRWSSWRVWEQPEFSADPDLPNVTPLKF